MDSQSNWSLRLGCLVYSRKCSDARGIHVALLAIFIFIRGHKYPGLFRETYFKWFTPQTHSRITLSSQSICSLSWPVTWQQPSLFLPWEKQPTFLNSYYLLNCLEKWSGLAWPFWFPTTYFIVWGVVHSWPFDFYYLLYCLEEWSTAHLLISYYLLYYLEEWSNLAGRY